MWRRLFALAPKAAIAVVLLIAAAVVQTGARPERVVNFYNWSDYIDPTVLSAFTKSTGINVRYDTFDSNDTLEAKLFAGKSGYDVVVPTGFFVAQQIAAGIFQKFDKSKLPNLVNAWPEIAERLSIYDPGNQYNVNYMWGTTGIGYNVKAVHDILGAGAVINSWATYSSRSGSRASRIVASTSLILPTISCRLRCNICISIRIRATHLICKKPPICSAGSGHMYANSTRPNTSMP